MQQRPKSAEEVERLTRAGAIAAEILDELGASIEPGVSALSLDERAADMLSVRGAVAAFKGYQPSSAHSPFPNSLCVSRNATVVHGVPDFHNEVVQDGDIITLDIGVAYEGMIVDTARTFCVGAVPGEVRELVAVTEGALLEGIAEARAGNRVGDIGAAIEEYVYEHGDYGIIDVLCGHGVGHAVHEEPQVPNFGRPGTGVKLLPGMVVAIEPMINLGKRDVVFDPDGYTVRTKDGTPSAHFEDTVVITEDGPLNVTRLR
ncbi:type I methionyl aminopeptidase [Patescibacteria group bacterium]|jgi:methionyl aminopeptidase|nr:type I methionyl aminopeptidase [Patescibacteria group bacterium]